jgi:hypothetical protein
MQCDARFTKLEIKANDKFVLIYGNGMHIIFTALA